MKNKFTANIMGVVRNGGGELAQTLEAIESLRQMLVASSVLIATNDNTDKTDEILSNYESQAHEVCIIRLNGLKLAIPNRTEIIAAARNATLEALFQLDSPYEFTIILDLDGPNANLDGKLVTTSLGRTLQWDGLFANQPQGYYDIYALRCPKWCEGDVWQEYNRSM